MDFGSIVTVCIAVIRIAYAHDLSGRQHQIGIMADFHVLPVCFLLNPVNVLLAADGCNAQVIFGFVKSSFLPVVPSNVGIRKSECKVFTARHKKGMPSQGRAAHSACFRNCREPEVRIRVQPLHISGIVIIRRPQFIDFLHDLNGFLQIGKIRGILLISDDQQLSIPLRRKIIFCFSKSGITLFCRVFQHFSGILQVFDLQLCKTLFGQHPVNQSQGTFAVLICRFADGSSGLLRNALLLVSFPFSFPDGSIRSCFRIRPGPLCSLPGFRCRTVSLLFCSCSIRFRLKGRRKGLLRTGGKRIFFGSFCSRIIIPLLRFMQGGFGFAACMISLLKSALLLPDVLCRRCCPVFRRVFCGFCLRQVRVCLIPLLFCLFSLAGSPLHCGFRFLLLLILAGIFDLQASVFQTPGRLQVIVRIGCRLLRFPDFSGRFLSSGFRFVQAVLLFLPDTVLVRSFSSSQISVLLCPLCG